MKKQWIGREKGEDQESCGSRKMTFSKRSKKVYEKSWYIELVYGHGWNKDGLQEMESYTEWHWLYFLLFSLSHTFLIPYFSILVYYYSYSSFTLNTTLDILKGNSVMGV